MQRHAKSCPSFSDHTTYIFELVPVVSTPADIVHVLHKLMIVFVCACVCFLHQVFFILLESQKE